MKKSAYHVTVVLTAIALLMTASAIFADEEEGDWKDMKQESKRMKLDETAEAALQALFAENPKAKELYDGSYGWAVFDNLKLALGFSGGGGNGVAAVKETNQKTYMKMGTAGVGLGLGANKYQVIFLFQDSQTYDNFVNKGWQADAGATASAGTNAAEVKTGFVNGIAIYQMTEKGLMANADIAGTKYWKNDKLN
jgi:lipid-binding SYLF domain-containing protein